MKKHVKILIILTLCLGLILINIQVLAATGKANKEGIRIREKASTDSNVLELLSENDEVEILSEENDWYKVRYKSGEETYVGYVRKDLLKVNGEVASTTDSTEKETSTQTQTQTENEKPTPTPAQEEKENPTPTATPTPENSEPNKEKNENKEKTENSTVSITENSKISIKNEVDVKILPLINSSKIGTIEKDTQITISEVIGKWCYIESEKKNGWALISKIEENASNSEGKEEVSSDNKETTDTTSKNTETKTMYVSLTELNLRDKPDFDSNIIDELSMNDKVTVLEKIDERWSKVEVNGKTGYAANNYLSETKTDTTSRNSEEARKLTETKKESETKNTTTVKKETTNETKQETKKASESNKVSETKTVSENSKATETKTSSESSKASETKTSKESNKTSETKTSGEKNKTTENKSTSKSSNKTEKTSQKKSSNSVTGEDIVAYAKNYLGYRYVYGTAGPNTFDCSGFTSYVYKHFGYYLNRTSYGQRSNGTYVKKSQLKAGDILCFNGHVGLYIGNGKFIHAENHNTGVKISSLSQTYYKNNYVMARRIIK